MTTSLQEFHQALLEVLPPQGEWSEEEYLWLTDRTNRLLEFTDGTIEVLPPPTDRHQSILLLLVRLFAAHIEPRDARDPLRRNRFWIGADLVLEIVSPDEPARDLVVKRREYEAARIPEYWIVNPLDETIGVLILRDDAYVEHGPFSRGTRATSTLFPGIAVEVSELFDAYYPRDPGEE